MHMSQMAQNNSPWPGSQLRSGVVFFWSVSGDKDAIFSGKFENYGRSVPVSGGTTNPVGYFSDVQVTRDYGKTWTRIESSVVSTNNNFYTNLSVVARHLTLNS